VREIVGNLLLGGDIHDPRLARVVVTGCRVTDDLGIARVYYTVLDEGLSPGQREAAQQEAEAATEAVRKRVRRELGRRLRIKYTPEVFFHYDETLDQARRIEAILEELTPGSAPEEEQE
jgi:ribosome-binding factor A